MNPVIKKLAEQAAQRAELKPDTGILVMEIYNRIFTELIVQECIDILEKPNGMYLADQFKSHFGIHD